MTISIKLIPRLIIHIHFEDPSVELPTLVDYQSTTVRKVFGQLDGKFGTRPMLVSCGMLGVADKEPAR